MSKINIDYSAVRNMPELIDLLHQKKVPENEHWTYLGMYQENKARENSIPLHGMFELTPLCNLDCKMCYVHLNNHQVKKEELLSVEQWKDVILQAHHLGMMNATLSGGECLIYPGFDELYLFLRQLGIKTSIKTNGVLLTKERLSFFEKYPPRSITISLYGSSDEAYRRVTGFAAFKTVYDNLIQLKDVSFPIYISITPSRYMYEDMDSLLDFVKRLDFPFSVNIALFPPRKETRRELCDLSIEEYAGICKSLRGSNLSQETPIDEEYEIPDYSKDGSPAFGIQCGAGRSSFTVEWNGILTGCTNLDFQKKNVLDYGFSALWKQINTEANTYPLPAECTECPYDKVCFNCVAFRSNCAPKGHCNKNVCERTKLFIKEGIYQLR